MAEISFKTALQITGDFSKDDDLIHAKRMDTPDHMVPDIMTVKQAKNRYDLKNEKVVQIESYFICGEYAGYLYVLKSEKGRQKA